MEILPNQNSAGLSPEITPAVSNAAAQITSDFEVFLQMLTAQMQYQDPLNPVDSTDYATQLATFSGVEQAVLTNDLLKSLTAEMSVGGLTEMASWVGKEVRSTAPAYFDGNAIELFPQPVTAADTTEIIVRDSAGVEVQRIPYASGRDELVWNGGLANGRQAEAGLYRFEVIGKTNGEVTSQSGVNTYNRVIEVRLDAGETVAVLEGGAAVPSVAVTALRDR